MLALDPSANHTLEVSGSAEIVANDCSVRVDSNHANAVTVSGSASVTADGNYITGGVENGMSQISTTPVLGVAPSGDPFADHPLPAVGSCDHTNYNVTGGTVVTLDPGVYCGGLKLHGGATVTLNPGVYVMSGGKFELSGDSILVGDGVTIRLVGNDAFVNSSGSSQMHLVAPVSGDFAGFVFFQEHDAHPNGKSVISGSGELYFERIIYFPTQELEMSGSSSNVSPSPFTAIISEKFKYSGSTELLINVDSTATNVPVNSKLLVNDKTYLSR